MVAEAVAVEEGLILESEPQQEAVWEVGQACAPSSFPCHCSLVSGLLFHGTSESLLAFLPAGNHNVPAYAVALFLQIQAMQLWLLPKAPKFLECSFFL